ncbi:MAG: hypothetical protein K2N83_02895, partial [Eubacterium sp.]|nr:hypothetical protein [Eubacterium sp.]
ATVDFEYKNNYGNIRISKLDNDMEFVGERIARNVISGKMIQSNGMDILVFERENSCTIEYKDNLTEYNIMLECDLDTAIEFAETIK